MRQAPISLQDLRRRIYRKAKSDQAHRFWGVFTHIAKLETLAEAYRISKASGGAPGSDGLTFEVVEVYGPSGVSTTSTRNSCRAPTNASTR